MNPYNLTPKEQKEVDDLAELVAERVRQLNAMKTKRGILVEAFIILQEFGEHEASTSLLEACKRIGDKLGTAENP